MANVNHSHQAGINLHAVEREYAGNPNGNLNGLKGQVCQDTTTGYRYINTDGTAASPTTNWGFYFAPEANTTGVDIKAKYGAKGDGATDDTGAFSDAVAAGVKDLFLPAGTYLWKSDPNIPADMNLHFANGAVIEPAADLAISGRLRFIPGAKIQGHSIVNNAYQWDNTATANEYALKAAGGGYAGLGEPDKVYEDGTLLTRGTAGSLAAGEWDYADPGSGNTIVVRLSDSNDPDTKADDYLRAGYGVTVNGKVATESRSQIFDMLGMVTIQSCSDFHPVLFGAIDDKTVDSTQQLNAYFASAKASGVKRCAIDGEFGISDKVLIDEVQHKELYGEFWLYRFTGATITDYGLEIKSCHGAVFTGLVSVDGWATYFPDRELDYGILISTTGRLRINTVIVSDVKYHGLDFQPNCDATYIDMVRVNDCGASDAYAPSQETFTFTKDSDSGGDTSINQESILDVDHFYTARNCSYCLIDGQIHFIKSVDDVNSQIHIYPKTSASSGTGDYYVGSGIILHSSDVNVLKFGKVETLRCGVGVLARSLYGAVMNPLIHYCGIGFASGTAPTGVNYNNVLIQPYFEANSWDVIVASTATKNTLIEPVNIDWSKWAGLRPIGFSDDLLTNMTVIQDSKIMRIAEYVKTGYIVTPQARSEKANVSDNTYEAATVNSNLTVNLAASDDDIRLFRYREIRLNLYNYVNGTITFQPDNAGHTVEGGSSYQVSALGAAALVQCILDSGLDWKIHIYQPAPTFGNASISPDANGNDTIAHGLGETPSFVDVNIRGDNQNSAKVQSVDATDITVIIQDAAGADVTSGTFTVDWEARA